MSRKDPETPSGHSVGALLPSRMTGPPGGGHCAGLFPGAKSRIWMMGPPGGDGPRENTKAETGRSNLCTAFGWHTVRPTSRLTGAGPEVFDCQLRRDPGVRCSRLVGPPFVDPKH